MGFHRPGATVLLIDNMPEMHATFTASRWKRLFVAVSKPSRRAFEWVFLELADVLFVVGFAEDVVFSAFRLASPIVAALMPYALIGGAIVGIFALLL